MTPAAEETPQGNAIFEELVWVHGMIRRDLATVRALAVAVAGGMPVGEVEAEVGRLRSSGPLWQLKVNCLRYCRFVHSHHNHEDSLFFPTLRRENPELGPVVDRLEADHRTVSDLLEEVEAAVSALGKGESQPARSRLVAALDRLAETLLEHLDFEERSAGPTIRRLHTLY